MSFPTTSLAPGSTGSAVQQLQDWLVSQGYLTAAQKSTGYGTYGPQTTAAVLQWQKDHGVDYSSGPGDWGPKSIATATTAANMPASTGGSSSATPTGGASYANASNAPVTPSVASLGVTPPTNTSTAGSYKGVPITPGTDAEIKAQIAAIDAKGGTSGTTGTSTTKTGGITVTSTGDPTLDGILKAISGVADGLVSNGYTIPANLQITPDLISQFLAYAHTAVDPYTKQLLDSRITDVNANLANFKTNYENSVGGRQQQFGTDLATEQNAAGGTGTAFSGMRNVSELNLANSANRDLSTLGANAGLAIGSAARAAAADVGAANAGGIQLPGLAGGSVSLSGGSRGSTGTTGPIATNYDPSIYTVGNIPSAGIGAANQLEQSYLAQYGTLAGLNSNSGKSAQDLIGMMSGIPGGSTTSPATPSLTANTTPSLTPTIPSSNTSTQSTPSTTDLYNPGYSFASSVGGGSTWKSTYTYNGNGQWTQTDPYGRSYPTLTTAQLKNSGALT